MLSESYRALYKMWKESNSKQIYRSKGEELKELILKNFRGVQTEPNEEHKKKYPIYKFTIEGCNCYKYVNKKADRVIIYIHGGGFFADLSETYWDYISEIFEQTNSEIYMPQYPVTPEHNCEPTYKMLLTLYKQILKTTLPNQIVIMGDSAGGGISLSFAMLLRDKKLPQPKEIIMISPCLKLAAVTEDERAMAEELDEKDPIISYPCMESVRKMWGGKRKKKDYIVNPFYGKVCGLPRLTLFTGTWDVLYLFNREFYERVKSEGIPLDFYVREKMIHAYIIFPVPESEPDRKRIIHIINRK